MNYQRIFSAVLLICFVQTACFKDPPRLDRKDRKVVDSLYNVERKLLLEELDSICDEMFDVRVKLAMDSIMEKRLKEIERLQRTPD